MAERTPIDPALSVEVPDDLDDVTAAAAGNPGMSSWAALTERAGFVAGESVLINGATGVSGRLAIQIARHLGARRIVVTGRNLTSEGALLALGADAFVPLDLPPAALIEAFQEEMERGGVDVVLDYLWGPPAEQILQAIVGRAHGGPARRVRFVQIGAMTSPTITLPGAALRSSGLELLGSGLGSVSNERLIHTIGLLLKSFRPAKMTIDAGAVPLSNVESAWNGPASKRVVFTL
jgi:NADPH:quinone reductase-like Zn-dependent oxidoreductase